MPRPPWAITAEMALVRRDEVGRLEALVDPFPAGFVNGRLVLAFDVPAQTLARWRDSSHRSDAMEGGVRRFSRCMPTIAPRAQCPHRRVELRAVCEAHRGRHRATFRQTFRAARDGRRRPGAAVPRAGIAAAVAASGTSRGVLQYVPPRDEADCGRHWEVRLSPATSPDRRSDHPASG